MNLDEGDAVESETSERSDDQVPTELLSTLKQLVQLYQQAGPRVLGYQLLAGVAAGVVTGAVVFGALTFELEGLAVLAVGIATLVVNAYFWAVVVTSVDNVYRGARRQGEFARDWGVVLRVAGTLVVKQLLLGLLLVPLWWLAFEFRGDANITIPAMVVGVIGVALLYLFVHFAELEVIVERSGVFAGIERSAKMVQQSWFYALLLVVGVGAIATMMVLPFMTVIDMIFYYNALGELLLEEAILDFDHRQMVSWFSSGVFLVVMTLLVAPFLAVAHYLVYRSLRARSTVGTIDPDIGQF